MQAGRAQASAWAGGPLGRLGSSAGGAAVRSAVGTAWCGTHRALTHDAKRALSNALDLLVIPHGVQHRQRLVVSTQLRLLSRRLLLLLLLLLRRRRRRRRRRLRAASAAPRRLLLLLLLLLLAGLMAMRMSPVCRSR